MKKLMFIILLLPVFVYAQLIGPKIVVQQSEYDFGTIPQGEKVTHVFVISNAGGDLLEIKEVKPSCGCTVAEPEKKKLAPGESTNLSVTFDSKGRYGKQKKLIRVSSNDPDNPVVMLTIKGKISAPVDKSVAYPVLHFTETQHDFGKVKEGEVVKYEFKFKNLGSDVLKISDVKTSCGCTAALVSSESVAPGEEGTLKVELDTSKRHGKMSRTVTIHSNDPKEPVKILTLYADVQ